MAKYHCYLSIFQLTFIQLSFQKTSVLVTSKLDMMLSSFVGDVSNN